jgi:hypothetical protein
MEHSGPGGWRWGIVIFRSLYFTHRLKKIEFLENVSNNLLRQDELIRSQTRGQINKKKQVQLERKRGREGEREREREGERERSRVIGLGELLPVGRLFSFGSFYENYRRSPNFWATFVQR